MVNVEVQLEKEDMNVHLLEGGSTTSKWHTALKIAPVYSAPVIHLKDVSQNAGGAAQLLNTNTRKDLEKELANEYQSLRQKNNLNQPSVVSIEEAQKNKLNLF